MIGGPYLFFKYVADKASGVVYASTVPIKVIIKNLVGDFVGQPVVHHKNMIGKIFGLAVKARSM